jgi:hypothetical protein
MVRYHSIVAEADRHGLGDTALSEGITSFIADIKDLYPGIYIHSVQIPENGTLDEERRAGFVSLSSAESYYSVLIWTSMVRQRSRGKWDVSRSTRWRNFEEE